MEEKERYELTDTDCILDAERNIVVSDVCDVVANADIITNLLNQQDKRIKELEEQTYPAYKREHKRRAYLENIEVPRLKKENVLLKQQLAESERKLEEYKKCNCKECMTDYEKNLNQIIDKYLNENIKLEQQLHDLPNKIVGEVEKNFTEYLPLKDKTGAGFYSRLNTILKKYGG